MGVSTFSWREFSFVHDCFSQKSIRENDNFHKEFMGHPIELLNNIWYDTIKYIQMYLTTIHS